MPKITNTTNNDLTPRQEAKQRIINTCEEALQILQSVSTDLKFLTGPLGYTPERHFKEGVEGLTLLMSDVTRMEN